MSNNLRQIITDSPKQNMSTKIFKRKKKQTNKTVQETTGKYGTTVEEK